MHTADCGKHVLLGISFEDYVPRPILHIFLCVCATVYGWEKKSEMFKEGHLERVDLKTKELYLSKKS